MRRDELATRDAKIVALFRDGRTLASIAEQFALSVSGVHCIVKRYGLKRRANPSRSTYVNGQEQGRRPRNAKETKRLIRQINRTNREYWLFHERQNAVRAAARDVGMTEEQQLLAVQRASEILRAELDRQYAIEDAAEKYLRK